MIRKLLLFPLLIMLFACTTTGNTLLSNKVKTETENKYTKEDVVGHYRAFAMHGYDDVKILDDNTIQYTEYSTGKTITYRYELDNDILKLIRNDEELIGQYNCHIEDISLRQLYFWVGHQDRECPLAKHDPYLTKVE